METTFSLAGGRRRELVADWVAGAKSSFSLPPQHGAFQGWATHLGPWDSTPPAWGAKYPYWVDWRMKKLSLDNWHKKKSIGSYNPLAPERGPIYLGQNYELSSWFLSPFHTSFLIPITHGRQWPFPFQIFTLSHQNLPVLCLIPSGFALSWVTTKVI